MKTPKQQEQEQDLPEEIIEKILLKLPVKDIIRCSSVSKPWNSLIKTTTFIQTHLLLLTNQRQHLLLLSSPRSEDLHLDASPSFGQYSKLLNPLRNNKWSFKVIGTCNGLVCIDVSSVHNHNPLLLWNPSIRKYGFLPSPNRTAKYYFYQNFHFGYDCHVNDFKIVRTLRGDLGPTPLEVEVWSLARGGNWTTVTNVPADFSPFTFHYAFVRGCFHWVQRHIKRHSISIVALDTVDESFHSVQIPQTGWRDDGMTMISRYPGGGGAGDEDQCWLALFEFQETDCFDLWVMKEYGVAESWTKLYNVHLPASSPEDEPCIEPFGFTKSGQVVVRIGFDGTLEMFKSYDPEKNKFSDFGIPGYKYYFMGSFIQSLVLLGQHNVFSY